MFSVLPCTVFCEKWPNPAVYYNSIKREEIDFRRCQVIPITELLAGIEDGSESSACYPSIDPRKRLVMLHENCCPSPFW